MNCPKCSGKMTQLLFRWVCDRCEPPRVGSSPSPDPPPATAVQTTTSGPLTSVVISGISPLQQGQEDDVRRKALSFSGVPAWAWQCDVAVAGGFVRDTVIGKVPRDLDLYVLDGNDVNKAMAALVAHGWSFVGKKGPVIDMERKGHFGKVQVIHWPKVKSFADLVEDFDFTCNGAAVQLGFGSPTLKGTQSSWKVPLFDQDVSAVILRIQSGARANLRRVLDFVFRGWRPDPSLLQHLLDQVNNGSRSADDVFGLSSKWKAAGGYPAAVSQAQVFQAVPTVVPVISAVRCPYCNTNGLCAYDPAGTPQSCYRVCAACKCSKIIHQADGSCKLCNCKKFS